MALPQTSADPNPKQPKYKFAFKGSVGLLPREVDKEAMPPPRPPESDAPTATAARDGNVPQ
jgi:hypothetical protein